MFLQVGFESNTDALAWLRDGFERDTPMASTGSHQPDDQRVTLVRRGELEG